MEEIVLKYLGFIEAIKTALLQLHWDADSLSQHKLCDDITDHVKSFQDAVSEIYQGINSNFKLGELKKNVDDYQVKSLDGTITDVLSKTKEFYDKLDGVDYVGIKSECETFIGQMQRDLYLVKFTLKNNETSEKVLTKESIEKKLMIDRLKKKLNENMTVKLNGVTFTMPKSTLKESIDSAIENVLNDVQDSDEGEVSEYDFYDILENCGWSYSAWSEFSKGVRFVVSPDSKNACTFDELLNKVKECFGEDKVSAGTAQNKYAPELKYNTIIILD